VFGGEVKTNSKLKLINSKFDFEASEIGYFDLKLSPANLLSSGEVGIHSHRSKRIIPN
jgi:translation elongation factor EF-4